MIDRCPGKLEIVEGVFVLLKRLLHSFSGWIYTQKSRLWIVELVHGTELEEEYFAKGNTNEWKFRKNSPELSVLVKFFTFKDKPDIK